MKLGQDVCLGKFLVKLECKSSRVKNQVIMSNLMKTLQMPYRLYFSLDRHETWSGCVSR